MRQEIDYSLKVEFGDSPEDPSRIFISMGHLINSFKEIDKMLSTSINSDFHSTQVLNSIENGSLISNIKNILVFPSQETLGEDVDVTKISEYFKKSKDAILGIMSDNRNISTPAIVNQASDNIDAIAEETGINKSIQYTKIESLQIAENVSDLARSVKSLRDSETAYLSSDNDNLEISKDCNVDTKAIIESLDLENLESDSEMILMIKKPDFLGNSMWEFRHENRSFTASISDEEWLREFHDGSVPLSPGDALRVKIRESFTHDPNGNVISSRHDVYDVLRVIHQLNIIQQETTSSDR